MLLITALALFGLVYTLTELDGPYGIIYKLRQHLGALECATCTAWWLAPIFALYHAEIGFKWAIIAMFFVAVVTILDKAIKRLLV